MIRVLPAKLIDPTTLPDVWARVAKVHPQVNETTRVILVLPLVRAVVLYGVEVPVPVDEVSGYGFGYSEEFNTLLCNGWPEAGEIAVLSPGIVAQAATGLRETRD